MNNEIGTSQPQRSVEANIGTKNQIGKCALVNHTTMTTSFDISFHRYFIEFANNEGLCYFTF